MLLIWEKLKLHLIYSRPHMKKSRYSQHSYLEDGELLLKYQVSICLKLILFNCGFSAKWFQQLRQYRNYDYLKCSRQRKAHLVVTLRPNLKMFREIWLVPLKITLNFSRFKPALNWNRFFRVLRRCFNSLNSDSDWGLKLTTVNGSLTNKVFQNYF